MSFPSDQRHSLAHKNLWNTAEIEQELNALGQHFRPHNFAPNIEHHYQIDLNASHISTDKAILAFGNFVFMSFIWVDFLIFPAMANTLIWLRLISSAFSFLLVYLAFYKKLWNLDKYALSITSLIGISGSIIIFTASSILPNPYNIMYLIGVIPLFSGVSASLRNSFKHVVFTAVVITVLFFFTAIYDYLYGKPHPISYVQELMSLGAPMMALFFLGVGLISCYLTLSIERNFRRQWLLVKLRELDAEHLATLSQRFKELSHIDDLTGIANRRQIITSINEHLAKQAALSLIILDVDFFKAYNDYYGHIQGDACLQKLAQCLSNSCQTSEDVVARYGGEEFIVFLPNADQHQAITQAKQILYNIELLKIPHIYGINKHVSASLGVTSVPANSNVDTATIIQQADEALYQAKDLGRNQVVSFSHS